MRVKITGCLYLKQKILEVKSTTTREGKWIRFIVTKVREYLLGKNSRSS